MQRFLALWTSNSGPGANKSNSGEPQTDSRDFPDFRSTKARHSDESSLENVKWREKCEVRKKSSSDGKSGDSLFSLSSSETSKKSRDSLFMTLPSRKQLRKATTGTRSSLRTSISVSDEKDADSVFTPAVRRLSEHPAERYSTNFEKGTTRHPGNSPVALRRFGAGEQASQNGGRDAASDDVSLPSSSGSKSWLRRRGSSFRTSKSTSSLAAPFKVSFVKTPPSSTTHSASPSPPPAGGTVWRTPFWKSGASRTAPPSPVYEQSPSETREKQISFHPESKTAPPSPPFFGGPSPKCSLFGGHISKLKGKSVFDRRRSVSDPVSALDDDSWALTAHLDTKREKKRKKLNRIIAKLKYNANAGRGWNWYCQSRRLAKSCKQGSQPTSYSCTNLDFLQQRVDPLMAPKVRGPPSDSGLYGGGQRALAFCQPMRATPLPTRVQKGSSLSGSTQTLSSSTFCVDRRAEQLAELEEQSWYWGPISREEAAARLAACEDGYFLVRDTPNITDRTAPGTFYLSFKSHSQVLDTRIATALGGRFYTLYSADASFESFRHEDDVLFDSVVELVRSLMQPDSPGLLCPVVVQPPPQRPVSRHPPGTIPPPPPQPRREFVRVHVKHPLSRETAVQPLAILAGRAVRRAAFKSSERDALSLDSVDSFLTTQPNFGEDSAAKSEF